MKQKDLFYNEVFDTFYVAGSEIRVFVRPHFFSATSKSYSHTGRGK